jgi:hypothetical protein
MGGLIRTERLRGRWLALAVAVVAAGLLISLSQARPVAHPLALTVQRGVIGQPVPDGFVGLSMEYRGLEAYAGQNPAALSPPFVQLLRNLAPGQRFALRIGGDSTDWTWYPVPHVSRPPGVKYDLNRTWVRVARALAQQLDARLVLGINLEADNRNVASGEAKALLDGIGSRYVDALELGNEPELYGSFNWYRTPAGVGVPGRPRGYDFADYLQDFSSFARVLPPGALAGPSSGSPTYEAQLGTFLRDESRVGLVTLHAYPLKHCVPADNVTASELLANASSAGLADGEASYVKLAHRRGVPLRIDELNAVSCGGEKGVSNAFVSSLWMLDALYQTARVGVDGVNVHTVPNTINELIGSTLVDGHWQDKVHPEYYGMMMFAQAAPAGSRWLRISSAPSSAIESFAARAPNGQVRLVLINRGGSARTVDARIPSAVGPGTVERLQAPSLGAQSGVTLAGQSFGSETTTGLLTGALKQETVKPVSGTYVVKVPGASAAMLTL